MTAPQNTATYFSSIRSHLSRRKDYISDIRPKTRSKSEVDFIDINFEDEDLALRPMSSHEKDGIFTSPTRVRQQPCSYQSAANGIKGCSSLCCGPQNHRRYTPGKVKAITFTPSITRLSYPDGTSCVIKRGCFRGVIDRRPSLCVYKTTNSLGHCTFKSCYCMTRPIVTSPLRQSITVEECSVSNDDENLSGQGQMTDESSKLGDKIRNISWVKLKGTIDTASVDSNGWEESEATLRTGNLPHAVPSHGVTPHRFKRSFIHENLMKFVGSHRLPDDPDTEILVLSPMFPQQTFNEISADPVDSVYGKQAATPANSSPPRMVTLKV